MTTQSALAMELEHLQQHPNTDGLEHVLNQFLESTTKENLVADLNAWFNTVFDTSLSIVSKRPLLSLLVDKLSHTEPSVQIAVGRHAIEALQSNVASYEEQDFLLRSLLAEAFTAEEEYVEAAKMLKGLQMESSQRKMSDEEKFGIWLRICRLYLEEDDTVTAETYLNRAKNLLYHVTDQEAQLKFKLSQARISDAQRRFLEAGAVYHDISTASMLADEERDLILTKGIICAILSPAGPPRTALLRRLYRDDRAQGLEEYEMLENMYLGRLVSPEQADAFSQKLDAHQVAKTSDGSSVLAKAIIEHNLLGISSLYRSIGVKELGLLLRLDPWQAEEYAARMVQQDRLTAHIDHVSGFVFFTAAESDYDNHMFNDRIRSLLEDVERVATILSI